MELCQLHIGADSFPMHLASALNTPTLAIFERSLASTAAPLNENSTIAASVYSLHTGDPAFYEQHAHRIAPCGLDAVKAEHLYPIIHKMGFIEDADFTPFPVREFEFMGHQIVSPEIDGFVYEDYETDDLNELKACEALNHYVIPNESVFMDVGANVGRNSLMIRGDIKKGIAIEPFPEIYNMLVKNLIEAGRVVSGKSEDIFTAYPIALAAEAGELYLNWSPRQSGCTSVKTFKEYLSIKVEATTMDALGHQPDLIKIDVEGAAVDVLKGAEKTLETARAIVLEIHNDTEGVGAIQFLSERGFRIRYISPPVNGVTYHILAIGKDVEMLPYPINCLFDPAEILTAIRNDVYPSKRLNDIVEATPEFNHDGTQWFEYMGLQTLKAGDGYERIGVYEGDSFFIMPAVMWLADIRPTTIVDTECEKLKCKEAIREHKRDHRISPAKVHYLKTVDEVRKQDTLICLNMLGYTDGLERLLALIKRTNPKQLYVNFLFSKSGEPTRYRGQQVYPFTRSTLELMLDALKDKAYHPVSDTDFENINISDTPELSASGQCHHARAHLV